jgi:serine/threonine-protein kinase
MDEPICPITEESLHELGPCGSAIDRYEVERWLGGGGFGAVYRARHAVMDRTVALKLLHKRSRTTARARERFFQEAKAAAAIGHPNIVQVFDAGVAADGTAFLAMELIDGCSLFDLLAVECLPVRRSLKIVLSVLDALMAAHQVGIIHRDVKPGNIMLAGTEVDGSRSEDRVKLVDFGISKVRAHPSAQQFTRSNASLGSPGYAAPEQYVSARDVDVRADVYSVGVVLYRLLSGELPFDADTYEQMIVQVCTEDAPSIMTKLPELSPALGATIDRTLARQREGRHESASALADELRAALDALPEEPSRLPSNEMAAEVMTTRFRPSQRPSSRPSPNLEATSPVPPPRNGGPLEATAPAGTWGLLDAPRSESLPSPKRTARLRRRAAFAGAIVAMMAAGAGILWSMGRDVSPSDANLSRTQGTALAEARPNTESSPSEAVVTSESRGSEAGAPEAGAAETGTTTRTSASRLSAPTSVTSPESTSVETRRRLPHKARISRRTREATESLGSEATDTRSSGATHRPEFGAEDLEPF